MENKKEVQLENTENKNEMVTMTKGQLKGLLDRVENLERGQKHERPKRVTEHFATMRIHEGKPVIWFGNVKEKWDDKLDKLVAWMDIKLEGQDKPVTVEYLEFLNSPTSVRVEIKSQKAEEIRELPKIGQTTAFENPDQGNWTGKFKSWQGGQDLEVVSFKYQAEIEILEGELVGKTFSIPSNCLNQ